MKAQTSCKGCVFAIKQEEEQSISIFYDYDLEPLPNDLVDMVNEKNKREK